MNLTGLIPPETKRRVGVTVLVTIVLVMIAIVAYLAGMVTASGREGGRTYHPYAIQDITAEDPSDWKKPLTHIEVEGWVAYVKLEQDKDTHVRLCDSDSPPAAMDAKHCIVAEVIPTLQPKGFVQPQKGMHLIVRGIGRYDGQNPGHHWWECHPIEEMEVLH